MYMWHICVGPLLLTGCIEILSIFDPLKPMGNCSISLSEPRTYEYASDPHPDCSWATAWQPSWWAEKIAMARREGVANVYYRNLSLSKYMKKYLAYHIAKISQVRMEISKYNVLNIYNRWMNIFHRPLNFCNNQCPFGRVPFPRLNYKDDISLEWSIYKFIWRI